MVKIILPNKVFGVDPDEALKKFLANPDPPQPQITQPQNPRNMPDLDGFIYVPAINLYVQKEKQLFGIQWKPAIDELISQGMKAPTIEEFRQFLIFLKQNPNPENTKIYNEITEVRDPYRAEWLDARFEKQGRDMIMFYHTFENGKIIEKFEKIVGYLNKNKTSGISLEKWLEDATQHGLPKVGIEEGQLYYGKPTPECVARFDAFSVRAGLCCDRDPTFSVAGLGVRGVRREAPRA